MNGKSASLDIEGVDEELQVDTCSIEERIGGAVVARVICPSRPGAEPPELDLLRAIGRRATLTLRAHDAERRFALEVEAVEDRAGELDLTLISPVRRLGATSDHRVFVDQSAVEIVEEVLREHGFRLELRAARRALKRAHTVQNFESDLDFCGRLLADEGMSWLPCTHDASLLYVVDEPSTFLDTGVELPLCEEAGLEVGRALHAAMLRRRVTVERASLRDHDFRRPALELDAASGDGSLEWYEFPGGFSDPGIGRERAAIRLAERRADRVTLHARATEPMLAAGSVFTLREPPDELPEERWLVLAIVHRVSSRAAAGELAYVSELGAVPATLGHRPPRPAPPPRGGAGTAVITGPRGREIAVDDHGRATVLHAWDRRRAQDDESSGWVRVVQPQLAGAIQNPRVGWETLVGFADRSGETPLVLGRVFNAVEAPPAPLPARKVESHLGTLTTPAGSSGNFVRIDDAAGREALSLNASGEYLERVENDKVTEVAASHERLVAGSRALFIKERLVDAVGGSHALTVTGVRKVAVDSNAALEAASEKVSVGAARAIRVGGDYLTKTPHYVRLVGAAKQEIGIEHQSVFTQGVSTLLVGGSMTTHAGPSESVAVAGAAVVSVSGALAINTGIYRLQVLGAYEESSASRTAAAQGKYGESYGRARCEIAGSASYTGAEVALQAAAQIVIKAGGVTITMTPASIVVDGDYQGSTPSVEEGIHRYG